MNTVDCWRRPRTMRATRPFQGSLERGGEAVEERFDVGGRD